MKDKLFNPSSATALFPRLIVGLVFLSEGLQKSTTPDTVGADRFTKTGFEHPEFWTSFTGIFEILCSILILARLLTRLVSILLLIIMAAALITTKHPLLLEKGFFSIAHEYQTEFTMTMLLLFLLYFGSSNNLLNKKLYKHA